MDSAANRRLLQQLVEEFDQKWGTVDFLDRWFTGDCRLHFNGATMDLPAYKEILPAFHTAFANVRHEIHFMLADGEFVTSVATLHLEHVGEWEGIAPSGRSLSVADIAVLRYRDGKIAEEWVVVDMAGLRQQLEAEG